MKISTVPMALREGEPPWYHQIVFENGKWVERWVQYEEGDEPEEEKEEKPEEESKKRVRRERRALLWAARHSDGEYVRIPISIVQMILEDLEALNTIRQAVHKLER